MRVDQFDFELPDELIAQTPLKDRDTSRLMVLNKKTGEVKHEVFHESADPFLRVLTVNEHQSAQDWPIKS